VAGKSYIKTGSTNWDRIKKMYVKTGGQTWTAIRKAYVKTSSGWQKVFDTASNRPFISGNDIPKIRLNTFRTNSTYDPTGTANDPVNPVVEAPPVQQMGPPTTTPTVGWPSGTVGNHLWGYDGTWVSGNGTSMTFVYSWLYNLSGNANDNVEELNATSTTGRTDMLTNSSTHLGQGDGDYFDKNFITFRVTATNSAGSASAESSQVYIVKQRPSGTINLINTSVDVPETLSASFTYNDEWYRKPDQTNSYIEWFAIDSVGEALTTSNRVAIQYLNSISTTGTTTKSGTVFHNATLANKIYSVRITLSNSNTQSAVIPISGFIPNAPFTAEDSTSPGSPLSVTTLNILDYYSNEGTDNRGYIPVGGLFRIQSNVTGTDGSTTYRIRYRMYNWQNSSYYGMDGTNYGTAASSAWTTRTGSNSSFGPGGTLISNISVSGTTATLLHNEVIDSSLFGSTTFTGGQDRWQIEIEVSALKNSIRKYYADVVGGIPYYVSRPATLLLTATPANAQVNQNVTLNGTITALGGGSSYPRQYKVSFGDGTDSGWLPVGGYSFGTANPTFQITKQYSTIGEYFPVLTTIPDYSSTNTYVQVAAALTAPTSTSIVSVSRLSDTTTRAVVSSSGGSGPYYQLYWVASATAPTTAGYDAASTTSTVTEDFSFGHNTTYYFYIRSSSQNLGNTIQNGTATDGTYSAYGPTTGAASYTFLQPSGSVSVSPTSGTAGTTEFTATASVSSAPLANVSYQWRFRDGTNLWLAISGATSSTYTPPSNYVSLYGGSLRCDIVANNGVGAQLVTNSSTVTVNAALAKLATPTNVSATDTRTDGVNITWTAVSGAAYYGIWWGGAPSYDSSPDFGGPSNPTLITGTSYLDTAITAGSSRTYYVQAFRTNNPTNTKSDWSAGDSGTRITAPVKLSTPTGVNATDTRTDGVNITWNAVSGASYYGVWWGGAPGYDSTPDFQNIFGTSYLDTSISAGSSRDYYVQAFASGNPAGTKSDWGGPNNGTRANVTISAPSTPTGVNTSGSGLVTWTASSGATSYTVEYYVASNSSGGNASGPYTVSAGSSTSYQITYPTVGGILLNYARARVLASNSGGSSAYSGFSPASGYV
jgi:hypothetical protein